MRWPLTGAVRCQSTGCRHGRLTQLRDSLTRIDQMAFIQRSDHSMTIGEDPFAVLGVDREASREEVKRAYRRLAMLWHPDRNPSPAAGREFKRVHAAYELLLDPQRLTAWREAAEAAAQGQGTTAESVADDLVQALTLSLEEAAAGCRRNVELLHSVHCRHCAGSGRLRHNHSVPCPACSGCGRVSRQGGRTSRCETCAGRGYLRETDCPACAGSGWRQESRMLAVTVPRGLLNGERLRLARQAPLPPGAENAIAGDLYLEISLAVHELFVLQGRDLHCQVPVSIFRRLAGGSVEVPTLRGSTLLELPPCAQQPGEHRLPGYGFPGKREQAAGDLVVHLQSVGPQGLAREDVALLEGLEERLNADLDQRAPRLARWQAQMRARRNPAGA